MSGVSVTADLSAKVGRIKPLHSVNNGPFSTWGMSNAEHFSAAGFPMARNHDASFAAAYGGAHTVDILAIFPNFDADEQDPASYDFQLTDEYCARIQKTGTKVFYRLGNKIEHESKKYGSIPPKDPAKWARICEHIIRHLNEGWANGHHMGIEYWEIWNEPDGYPSCWAGTPEQFYELYAVAATHLKTCFPHLKIGGPAVTERCFPHPGILNGSTGTAWTEGFFARLTKDGDRVPLDFFSFHLYCVEPSMYGDLARMAREMCDAHGYPEAELILNEWNYMRHSTGREEVIRFRRTIPSLKGSAFCACALMEAQHSPMDHFMYYDARPFTCFNGLFDMMSLDPLPPYYAFYGWNVLYTLGQEIAVTSDDPRVRCAGARSEDGRRAAVLFSYYDDHDSLDGCGAEALDSTLTLRGLDGRTRVQYRVLDGTHSLTPVSTEIFGGVEGTHTMCLPLYTTVLVEIEIL